ncbi:MAG: 1-deoxy-D-xylulose-5-phosphate reductoisomerase, partial [Deltaproteobacteria bacterium]|nr:1-deoxy-D-xylulose-5-phosphate reductoisomerase [Deltaproteobacteria bacterium]
MKNIAILGSTGSIGVNALKVIQGNPEEYKVIALAAGRNVELLMKQIEEFRPRAVAVLEEKLVSQLKDRFAKKGRPEIFFGTDGFKFLVSMDQVDTVIS